MNTTQSAEIFHAKKIFSKFFQDVFFFTILNYFKNFTTVKNALNMGNIYV